MLSEGRIQRLESLVKGHMTGCVLGVELSPLGKVGRKEWGRHSSRRDLPRQGSGGVSQAILERLSLHSKGQEMPGVSNEGLGSILGALGSHGRAESKGGTGLTLRPWNPARW